MSECLGLRGVGGHEGRVAVTNLCGVGSVAGVVLVCMFESHFSAFKCSCENYTLSLACFFKSIKIPNLGMFETFIFP